MDPTQETWSQKQQKTVMLYPKRSKDVDYKRNHSGSSNCMGELRWRHQGFHRREGDPGFSAPEMKGKHSLKASVTSELVFQDCRIPKDRILPGVKGLRGPFSVQPTMRDLGSLGVLSGLLRHATILPKPCP